MATRQSWSPLIIAIHWLTALTVFSLFGVGLWMVELNYYSEWYRIAPYWHKSIGLILATLTLIRIAVRMIQSRPDEEGKPWEKQVAKLVHAMLYMALITLFISGYLISTADGRGIEVFNWLVIPSAGELFENQETVAGDIHFYTAWFLISMVVAHAAAAIKHHVIDKDRTLVRMIKPE